MCTVCIVCMCTAAVLFFEDQMTSLESDDKSGYISTQYRKILHSIVRCWLQTGWISEASQSWMACPLMSLSIGFSQQKTSFKHGKQKFSAMFQDQHWRIWIQTLSPHPNPQH
jgi:hypothetical protein